MITQTLSTTIPTGAGGASPVVDLGDGYRLTKIEMPSAWTAGDISIISSGDNESSPKALWYGDATQVLINVAAGIRVSLTADQQVALIGDRYIQLVSVANQASARTVKLTAVLYT